jgi:hypothetical protein
MTLIGIDPGPVRSAAVLLIDGQVAATYFAQSQYLIDWLFRRHAESRPLHIACEHIQCMGMAVGATVFETAYWVGEYRHSARLMDAPFLKVFRGEVKMHLCGSMRAKDGNIRQALLDRYGEVGTKKAPGPMFGMSGDLWSALAVATTAADKLACEAILTAQGKV